MTASRHFAVPPVVLPAMEAASPSGGSAAALPCSFRDLTAMPQVWFTGCFFLGLGFLDLQVDTFHQILKFFCHIFSNILVCPPFFLGLQLYVCWTVHPPPFLHSLLPVVSPLNSPPSPLFAPV